MDLDPLTPADGREMYLDARHDELSADTLSAHGYRLAAFVRWCDREGIKNLNDLAGRDLHHYRVDRGERDGLKPVTLQGQLSTLRTFLKFCVTVEAVEEGLAAKIILPSTSRDEEARDMKLNSDHAGRILAHLRRYQFASRDHAVFSLAWHTGMRLGGLRAIDLEDYHPEDRCVELRHRPRSDTPLKNGTDGERDVALTEDVVEVLEAYISVNRRNFEDGSGRRPLFTTAQGRLSRSGFRNVFYRVTCPCLVEDCPHDRDPSTCEALVERSAWSRCPSSVSAHPVRRGSITHQLSSDIPEEIVSGRVNATRKVLEKHYDRRTEREKMEQRRGYLRRLDHE